MLEIRETNLKGVFEITPKVFGDARGWFLESWSDRELKAAGIDAVFVQDNHSFSAEKGTLRGLHYQLNPMAQAKILRVTRGEIFDVAVDIRKGSPQYAKWIGVRLSAENKKQIFIPRGFAHGFVVLSQEAVFTYKVDNVYAPQAEGGIRWDDPTLHIEWPIDPADVLTSEKDLRLPYLKDAELFE